MATTRFWKITSKLDYVIDYVGNKDKTADYEDLKRTLHYAVNDQKTIKESKVYVTGINCDVDSAYAEFEKVKAHYDKGHKILGYHGYMSFAEGEVTAEIAHKIGVEFAEQNFPGFQVVVATHLNTGIIHNHFVVNSVSMEDGHMAHDEVSWFKFRHLADAIVRAHSLSVVAHPKRSKRLTQQQQKVDSYYQRNDRNIIRNVVDEAISECKTIEEFKRALARRGYNYNLAPNRKYWTVTPKGGSKSFRLYHLGDEYTNQAIRDRLNRNHKISRKRVPDAKQLQIVKYTGSLFLVVRLFKHYKYMLDTINKHPARTKYWPHELRSEVRALDNVSQAIRLMEKQKIHTMSELMDYQSNLQRRIDTLVSERRDIYNKMRRVSGAQLADELNAKHNALSTEITKARKELRLCNDTKARTEKIQSIAHKDNETIYVQERSNDDRSRDSNSNSVRNGQDII